MAKGWRVKVDARRLIKRLSFALALVLVGGWAGTGAAQTADLDAGFAAYQRGDYATAYREFKALAGQGDAAGQYNLAVLYDLGRGPERDIGEAVKWYQRAAAQGNADAQVMLGVKYANKEGVPQDLVLAYAYFSLAAAQGHGGARTRRDTVAARLSATQIGAARRLLRESRRSVTDAGSAEARAIPARALIANIQKLLDVLGYDPGGADGVVGEATTAAVRAFQRDQGLIEDGEATSALLGRLDATYRELLSRRIVRFGKGVLWKVEDGKAEASYLFGTIHSSDRRVLDIAAPVKRAFYGADSVALEIAPPDGQTVKVFAERVAKGMRLAPGRSLDDILGAELFGETVRALRPYGFTAGQLRRFKPWVIYMLFSTPPGDLRRSRQRRPSAVALDMWLGNEARRRGTPVHGLETLEEQFAVFESMAERDQVALLESTIAYAGEATHALEELMRFYLARDIAAIFRFWIAPAKHMGPDFLRAFMERLLDRRNVVMVARMAPLLGAGNAFIAVGAAHLPGDKGILYLLEQQGYQISRVY
jgi:uncharacterized protein YbaP (TraB family)